MTKKHTTLINEHEAADILGFAVSTMRYRRCKGLPPKFHKLGTRVMYNVDDIEEYITGCLRLPNNDNETKTIDN